MALTIDSGLCDYQTLQRDATDRAAAVLAGRCDAADGAPVECRVLYAGRPVAGLDWRAAGALVGGAWSAEVSGIPVGGPYRVEVRCGARDEDISWVDEVLVGDLWFIGGQSNGEGYGLLADLEAPSPLVHSYSSAERWEIAEEPLHWLCDSIDACHADQAEPQKTIGAAETRRNRTNGAGPGLAFAKEMVARTGVPVGLVPCAHGGTSMEEWSPALRDRGGASLYGSMIRRLTVVGGRAAGIVWYQGESDAQPGIADLFESRLDALIAAFRADFGDPDLPFAHVQIGRWAAGAGAVLERAWGLVRDVQGRLPDRVPRTAVAVAIDLPLDDGIHISDDGQRRLGRRLATAVCARILGQAGAAPGPAARSARVEDAHPAGRVRVTFDGVDGALRSRDRTCGFTIRTARGRDLYLIFRAGVDPERPTDVLLMLNGPVPAGARLWYGYGVDPVCNVVDGRDMAVPAFGPMGIEGAGG